MPDLLLATCSWFPDGEPGVAALDRALAARGVSWRWERWDDPEVEWGAARMVAVRSTWDYDGRLEEFLAWVERVGPRLLNGVAVLRWNTDKAYLCELADAGVPVVPTTRADDADRVAEAVDRLGTAVVKPRVGAGGRGVQVVRAGEAFEPEHLGPWVVQPLVESVRTLGETSVFVMDGAAVSQVDKRPGAGEIRVHEHLGGTSTRVSVDPRAAEVATSALGTVADLLDADLAYGRVDLMRLEGRWVVGELELTEPGLYLDLVPGNADHYAATVTRRLR